MIEQPNYYTVIPAYVRYDEDLLKKPKSILIFGEITALSNQKGYCWASNAYLGKRIGVTERSVQDYLAILIKKRYVRRKIIYKPDSKEVDKRILIIGYPPETPLTPHEADFTTPHEAHFVDNTTRFEEVKEGNEDYQQHPLAYYQQAFGLSARGNLVMLIDKYANYFGNEIVNYAFDLASENGKDFAYAKGILNRWGKEKISTLNQAIKAHEAHSNRNRQSAEPQMSDKAKRDAEEARQLQEQYEAEKENSAKERDVG